MKNAGYLISILLIFSSCSTMVFLTRTVPPELILEKEPARIVFSNQFDYQANPEIKDKHEAAYKTGVEEFGKALLNDNFHENPVVIFRMDTIGSMNKTAKLFEGMLLENKIGSVCMAYDADFLLSLDSLRLYFEWEVIREEDPMDGSVSKTKDFYLFNNYYVTLYDATGGIVERTLLERSHLYTSRLTLGALITVLPNLDKAKEKISNLAHEAGIEYIGMFYPSEENYEQRKLYTGKGFKETNSLIFSRQYDEAIGLLQKMASTPKPKLAEKVQHNLSVAKELKLNTVQKIDLFR